MSLDLVELFNSVIFTFFVYFLTSNSINIRQAFQSQSVAVPAAIINPFFQIIFQRCISIQNAYEKT